jgi:formylglycine-generating enzyme required for sulfatase activity
MKTQKTPKKTLEQKPKTQTQQIISTQDNLERVHQNISQLTQNIQQLSRENLDLKNRLSQLQQREQESYQKILTLEKKFVQLLQLTQGKSKNYIENAVNGINLEMVYIPAGEFMMGSHFNSDELPIHKVELQEFYLGKYPITQAQYQKVMGENNSDFKGVNNPVECVSWNDAQEFCRRLSQLSGRKYLLPNEAQWEYACRAGVTEEESSFGNDENQLKDYCWYNMNSERRTHPVGQKKPNNWGLYDMHGNVWEWCQDDYVDNYYDTPRDGSAYKDESIQFSVLRGGSWFIGSMFCRSAKRTRATYDSISSDVGFRVMCSTR